jgi:excisionase family DNA binding protein
MNKVFTTGQVARICKVSPRTVTVWFDSGKLRGYRIPGSQNRRIPRDMLIRFLKEHGMPLGGLEDDPQDSDAVPPPPSPPTPAQRPASAPETAPVPEGVEALQWLRSNTNAESFPLCRFAASDGSTREAVRFVERLYALGALRVVVPSWAVDPDGGPFADQHWARARGLAVVLPAAGPRREALLWLCAREMARGEASAWCEPEQIVGCRVLEVAW